MDVHEFIGNPYDLREDHRKNLNTISHKEDSHNSMVDNVFGGFTGLSARFKGYL